MAYEDDALALGDALRLARAMSYKCALAEVNCGGGKAVIIGDPAKLKTTELLHAYGRFLNRIGSCYATGEDVGMSVADVELIKQVSPYIGGTDSAGAGDPSVFTAKGVFHGLRAILEARFATSDFTNVHFAVQGLGNVGMALCRLLHEAGARLTVADIRSHCVSAAAEAFGCVAAAAETIHSIDADIFVPCALGGVINAGTIGQIKAKAVAGAANNQLAAPEFGPALRERGILFAPDFVINAGGVIGAVSELNLIPGRTAMVSENVDMLLAGIHDRLLKIFILAQAEGRTPEGVAFDLARTLIGR